MRAIAYALIGALTFAAVGAVSAADTANRKGLGATTGKHGQGTGVIKAIDAKAGTITLKHGPIPAVSWPAMTMTFKATPPTLLTALKVGQTIGFDTTVNGMAAEITAVRPK
jgi:Cu(I)/Ag(I) efflux system protein CusF